MLGVGRAAIYRAVRTGDVPHRRIGKRVLFSRRALQRWLAHEGEGTAVATSTEEVRLE